jgi:hypothetical protein
MSTQKAITKEQYNQLTPRSQGYVTYMQEAWNSEVPSECPYKEGTKEYKDWNDGNFRAMLDVQDGEE